MRVKLVAITKPLVGDGNLTASDFITFAARVSNPSNQMSLLTAPKLLAYCIKHGHWSIFEQASMTVEIQTSRAISAQIIRHRSFCFQEFSQRYAPIDEAEPVELRTQDLKNRQASGDTYAQDWAMDAIAKSIDLAFKTYRSLLQEGVSRETARMVLPLATQTTLYMTGNIRSWIHYLEQRCAKGTQLEHRRIAEAIRDTIFAVEFPHIHNALQEAK
jgi:thymidylate synthase (FAD)